MTRTPTAMGPALAGMWLVNVDREYGCFRTETEAQAYAARVGGMTPEHRARIAAAGREGWQRGYDTCVAEKARMGAAAFDRDTGIIDRIGDAAYAAAAARHDVEVDDVLTWVTSRQDEEKEAPCWDAA
nr:hypothetical protein [Methylobacterium sp. L1A1]